MKSNTLISSISGSDLPFPLSYGAAVPFEKTFFIVGGTVTVTKWHSYSDKVFRYTEGGTWQEMHHLKLKEPKYDVTAMMVSSSQFH